MLQYGGRGRVSALSAENINEYGSIQQKRKSENSRETAGYWQGIGRVLTEF